MYTHCIFHYKSTVICNKIIIVVKKIVANLIFSCSDILFQRINENLVACMLLRVH